MNEHLKPTADFNRAMDECRELFGRLSERNRMLAQEWQSLTSSIGGESGSTSTGDWTRDAFPHVREFGESLLRLHEQFFETCRDSLQARVENESLRSEKAAAQSELARLSEQVLLIGRAQADLAAEKSRIEEILEQTRVTLAETELRAAQFEAASETLQAELAGLSGSAARLEELEATSATLAARAETLEAELRTAREERDAARARWADLETERDRARNESADHGRELESARGRIQELERDLLPLREARADTEAERKTLRDRIEELEQHYSSALGRITDLESALSEGASARKALEAELGAARSVAVPAEVQSEWKRRIEALEQERDALKESVHRLELETSSARDRIRELTIEARGAETLRTRTEDSLRALEAEKAAIAARLETALGDLARIRESPPSPEVKSPPPPEPLPSSPPVFLTEPIGPVDPAELDDEELGFQSFASVAGRSQETDPLEGIRDRFVESDPFLDPDASARMDSLAFQEDDRLFDELTRGLSLSPSAAQPPETDDGEGLEPGSETDSEASSLEPKVEEPWGMGETVDPVETALDEERVADSEPDSLDDSINAILDRALGEFDRIVPAPEDEEDDDVPTTTAPAAVVPEIPFPYPEITGARMESFQGRKVLLVGGDDRFLSDYETMFSLVRSDLTYFPSLIHLERKGTKRHVRDSDVVIIFGRAVQEPGMERVRELAGEFGRPLIEHASSGLVSLYHRLQRSGGET